MNRHRFFRLLAWVLFCALPGPVAQAQTTVDLELILAIDCSYSVDPVEYQQQVQGLANAFRTDELLEALQTGPTGTIAVSVVQWSDVGSHVMTVPWTMVRDRRTASRFAARILAMPRTIPVGSTSISSVVGYALTLFDRSPFQGIRRVLDISGDGRNNTGPDVETARNAAVFKGITVNGLAIAHEHPTLDIYFRQKVVGGTGAFVIKAESYSDYARAILAKLVREIGYIPVAQLDR